MTEHQQRLWQFMIDLIQSYLNEETDDFYSIVGKLEGAFDAAEISDSELVKQWYDFWTPLEIRRAVEGNAINRTMAVEELSKMKSFLEKEKQ